MKALPAAFLCIIQDYDQLVFVLRLFLAFTLATFISACAPGLNLNEIIPCKGQPWFESVKSPAKELTPQNYEMKTLENDCTTATGLTTFDITSANPLKDYKQYFHQKAISLGWRATHDNMSYRKCVEHRDTHMYLVTDQGETKWHHLELEALDSDGDSRCT